MKNKIIVLIALVGFTVLLLELPKLYYKISDNNLLLYEGKDHHEAVVTSTVSDLSLKIESFFRTNADLATSRIGYASELSKDETEQVMKKMSSEFKIITGPDEESVFTEYVFSEEAISNWTKRCYTAQILYRKGSVQHVWELGYLDLFAPHNNVPFGTIIYDTDTYKILLMTWRISEKELENYVWKSNSNRGPFVKEYYEDISEAYSYSFIDYGLGGHFYPASMYYNVVDTETLYSDLKELARSFWYFTYQEQYTLME